MTGVFQRERFDVDDARFQSRGFDRRAALIDILGASRDEQHVVHFRIVRRRAP